MGMSAGSRVGPYAIVAPIGAGGMGEVYRARDTRLDRDVAIKILPPAFAADAERLARFEREAKTLASLNHPHIAAIYGIEPAETGGRALVMELVEGEDLSARIARGPVPVAEALALARQITDALDAAHERGVIHRDLKPANIKVREDGTLKVLDFGLAKAVDPSAGSHPDLMNSPTITSPATQLGMILGTAAYMAPEQARGKPVDKRADIWAFGCVLYEMLTATRAFPGSDVSETLASVLAREVDWTALPAGTPAPVRALLAACLQKEKRDRLRDLGDAWLYGGAAVADVAAPVPRTPWLPWAVAALALVAAAAIGTASWRSAPAPSALRMSIALPDGHRVTSGPIISRDGSRIVFAAAAAADQPKLYLRTLDTFELRALAGTEDAVRPFFSPDGRWVGFFARRQLWKLDLDGGAPVPLAEAPTPGGGTWAEDGTIVFVPVWNGGLYVVRPGPDRAELLLQPDPARKEYAYTAPVFLPGGRELLFSVWGTRFDIARVTFPGLERAVAAAGFWTSAVYAGSGHLLAGTDQSDIVALPYPAGDARADPVSVLDNVHWSGGEGDGFVKFAVSANGTLVYAPGDIRKRSLVIVDEAGRAGPVPAAADIYLDAAVSPDGRRAVVGQSGRLWIVDLERGTRAPLAPDLPSAQSGATWSRDGSRVFFGSNVDGNWEIWAWSAARPGRSERVLERAGDQYPSAVAPDGALSIDETHPKTGRDIWMLEAGGGAPVPWLVTSANEDAASYSPDGRWVVYRSDSTGRTEVYVQARTGASPAIQVSTAGGDEPVWAPAGAAVFYREGNAMMAADIRTTPALASGTPRRLFDGGWDLPAGAPFSVMPDGRRFLMVRFAPESTPTRIDVVFNWFDELRKRTARR